MRKKSNAHRQSTILRLWSPYQKSGRRHRRGGFACVRLRRSVTPLLWTTVICKLPIQSEHDCDDEAGRGVSKWRDSRVWASSCCRWWMNWCGWIGGVEDGPLAVTAEPQFSEWLCCTWLPSTSHGLRHKEALPTIYYWSCGGRQLETKRSDPQR
jgi:hypothetical protein